ncbi:DUF1361 domain-containing protein [Brevibacillus sp. SYSU BS000544]|uniref:DUF1361 domain-containing protein n=1 Tax=Brevibacillus sp. SYSU BS000544 TaxID=3416443 RepID=UPI003CE56146
MSIFQTNSQLVKLILALLFASCICGGMAYFRVYQEQSTIYLWLIRPNLVLAWIPLFFAVLIHLIWTVKKRISWSMILLAVPWLLFLPNAPYIVTDLVHLTYLKGDISVYFDLMLNFLTAFTALFIGFLSIYLLQKIIQAKFQSFTSWIFVLMILFLCSIGVFLGRFLRWNSWDIVSDFSNIIIDSLRVMSQMPSLFFLAIFTVFLIGTYAVFYCSVRLK